MAKTPERTFQDWIFSNFNWFFQRIETTTDAGIPDLWACSSNQAIWIETKACPLTNVQIRKSQYAWMTKVFWKGHFVWVWNRSPKKTTVIHAWRTPFQVAPGKKNHLKIVSKPTLALPSKTFAELTLKDFVSGK